MESLRDNFKLSCEAEPLTTLLKRVLLGLGAPLSVMLGVRWLLNGGRLLCLFYEITGLYCPGCGSGRAALALLHGHFPEALRCNPLLFLLGLPCGALLIWEYLRFVFPGLGLCRIALPVWGGRAALALILGFWLLRNIPALRFLAP